eukprot:945559-Pelagomonas_calceolata.AAC.1
MDNLLQKWILTVLGNLLGVKPTTPSWSILRESGIEPFQFNWFHALCASITRLLSAAVSFSKTFSMLTSALAP